MSEPFLDAKKSTESGFKEMHKDFAEIDKEFEKFLEEMQETT
jgi:hypothetical protein